MTYLKDKILKECNNIEKIVIPISLTWATLTKAINHGDRRRHDVMCEALSVARF